MQNLKIGQRLEVYRIERNTFPWEDGDFKVGSWSIGTLEPNLTDNRNVYHNNGQMYYARPDMITLVGCLVIKKIKKGK